MSLPTSYPGNLVPTSGDLTILPRFPSVDEVVLINNQIVLASLYVEENLSASLSGAPAIAAVLAVDARDVDCIVTVQGIAELIPDVAGSASGISKSFSINNVATTTIPDFCPDHTTTGGNSICISAQARSGVIPAGTAFSVRMILQGTTPLNDITTGMTSLVVTITPAPIVVP